MLVSELIEKLQKFDPALEVKISTPAGGKYAVELRELMDANRDEIKSVKQAVCIFGSNGGSFGYPPLDYERRWKILEDFEMGERFTGIHGDCRMYNPRMGSQATCYGTAYDPRLFWKLREEGYVERIGNCPVNNDVVYVRTSKPVTAFTNGESK